MRIGHCIRPGSWRFLAIAAPLAVVAAVPGNAGEEPASLLALPVVSSTARPVAAFNAELSKASADKQDWAGDPLRIVATFAGWANPRTVAIVLHGDGEFPSRYAVTAIVDGFSDDSVRGERLDIVLDRGGGDVWQIVSAQAARRCWRGGKADRYAAEPCS